MTRRLIIRPEAYADLAEAHDWYESKRPGLGAEMAATILRRLREVAVRPTSFPIRRDPEVRRALVDRFPYAAYFTTRPDAVVVLAILHNCQDEERHLSERI